jgi:hypothetical protein
MSFLNKEELQTSIYQFQIDQITEGDDTIIETGIATAIEEVKSYLDINNQRKNSDGRLLYDTQAIFNASGEDRNSLILAHTKTVAIWHIIQLCNADVIYENVKERYDRAISWLRDLASGKVNLSTLPQLDPEGENPAANLPFRMGSRTKFNHE